MSLEPTLLSLPEVVKDHLMQYLNYIDIARLRKTCHVFRQYLTVKKPDANIPTIEVMQFEEGIELQLKEGFYVCLVKIQYLKVDEGCSIETTFQDSGTRAIRAYGENYLDVFSQDFSMLLQHQKSISDEVDFTALETSEGRADFWNTIRRAMEDAEATTGKKHLLKKRNCILHNVMAPDVINILPYFDPNCLQLINFSGEEGIVTPLDGIVALPQWNHLKDVTLYGFQIGIDHQNITHLETFHANVRELTAEDLLQIKNMMLRSGQLKHCALVFNANQDESFLQSLGPIFEEMDEGYEKTWKFDSPIPGKVLEVECFFFKIFFKCFGPRIYFEMK
ncbi:hypothetical protein CRE_23427 [Caenorhabditis remanei]|uniref:F-box domain-containing protein n=1 Tax=Caenorhabditis remanei TaxID=31234 RepID=E3MGQ7_CAERE|nr:hypothetical protein CRE_23427 [Caenorhabditis remanei]